MLAISLFLLCFFHKNVSAFLDDYRVEIKNDGPVVLGANITFRAEVYKHGKKDEGTFEFDWRDSMEHTFYDTKQGVSIWRVSHSPKTCKSGNFEVQVTVYRTKPFFWSVCFGSEFFELRENLVGHLVVQQNNSEIEKYVSSELSVRHIISLHGPDNEYLKLNASNYNIEWRIDENRTETFNNLSGLIWSHRFREADVTHTITAVIVAARKVFNSSTSLECSKKVDFVDSTNSFDSKLNNATDPSFKEELSYSISNNTATLCKLETQVCGIFSRKITVKAPITNLNVAGNNWLKHEDMLQLRIICNGSGVFEFCARIFIGSYKVLGNETCKRPPEHSALCDFTYDHYFRDSQLYTVLLILSNDVSKNISSVGVNFYEVTKHPQLSVVVVPLMASILAIILIIFGIAFYFQNRSSYTIEVADFDFTNNNDLEYKTFKERLAEAIHNAFNKPEEFSEDDSYNGVPSTSNKKYGSMQ